MDFIGGWCADGLKAKNCKFFTALFEIILINLLKKSDYLPNTFLYRLNCKNGFNII